MPSRFLNYPAVPKSQRTQNAFAILCNTHDASSSFLDIFEETRTARKAVGAPTDEEQDLLRAMLTFASAGLDSMFKQLIRDALPHVILRNEGARAQFRTFVEKRLSRRDALDNKLLADVLTSPDPRSVLIAELVSELVAASLQSKEQLLRAAAYFNIPSVDINATPDRLVDIFAARNQIAHEMDIDFNQPNRSRRPRRKKDMIQYASELLRVANVLLTRVDALCAD